MEITMTWKTSLPKRVHISAKCWVCFAVSEKAAGCGAPAVPGVSKSCVCCPKGQVLPLLEPFYCLTLQNSPSSRASSLPQVPLPAPEATGLAKVRKYQYNSQRSFSTLNFEADALFRTQRSLRPGGTHVYKLSPLPGTLEDILYTAEAKSLLGWHRALDKKEATAFWRSLPGQACIWHMPWELRVHTEHSWLETSCLKVPDMVNHTELKILTLEGWKAESALLGFKALRSQDIWNLSFMHQTGREELSGLVIYSPFSSEPKLFWRLLRTKKNFASGKLILILRVIFVMTLRTLYTHINMTIPN